MVCGVWMADMGAAIEVAGVGFIHPGACALSRIAALEGIIEKAARHVCGVDNLPPWEGALDAGVEAMARRIAALEAENARLLEVVDDLKMRMGQLCHVCGAAGGHMSDCALAALDQHRESTG